MRRSAPRFPACHVRTVAATELALARIGRPLPNAALLGAFAALTRELAFDSVAAAIRRKFAGKIAEANVSAARAAYEAIAGRTASEAAHA